MKRFFLLACLLLNAAQAAEDVPFYIGTYTSEGGSRGIYRAELDAASGKLSQPILAAEANGPSFVAIHPNGRFLYAVHEPTGGDVSAFRIGSDGKLTKINSQSSGGGGPCHVSVSPDGKCVFTASYGAGSLACLPVKNDGSLAEASEVIKNEGNGPNKSRQEGPHLHSIYADASNRFVYACDLGTDEVLMYRLDSSAGSLTPLNPPSAKVPPGGGPRHLALHPDGRFAFVNDEMGNAVTVFERNPSTGLLNSVQTISTLPGGRDVPGNTTSEIALHPTGKWLYVSNRGHDSIAVFAVGSGGKLSLVEITLAGVAVPRGFGIAPSGRWLVVAGQKSNDLTALSIDPKTGKLSSGPNRISVAQPVCVAFAEP
jgi:6-phosphogluconolactonase